jgi:hypothetical protein
MVVDASLRGLGRGRLLVVPGAIYKLVVALEKLAPRALWGSQSWLQPAFKPALAE